MISYITYQQLICYNTSSILLIIKISDVFTNFLIVKEVKYKINLFFLSQKAIYIHTCEYFTTIYTNANYRLSSAPYMDIIGPIITDMRRITIPASTSIIIGSRAAISVCVAISTSSS